MSKAKAQLSLRSQHLNLPELFAGCMFWNFRYVLFYVVSQRDIFLFGYEFKRIYLRKHPNTRLLTFRKTLKSSKIKRSICFFLFRLLLFPSSTLRGTRSVGPFRHQKALGHRGLHGLRHVQPLATGSPSPGGEGLWDFISFFQKKTQQGSFLGGQYDLQHAANSKTKKLKLRAKAPRVPKKTQTKKNGPLNPTAERKKNA